MAAPASEEDLPGLPALKNEKGRPRGPPYPVETECSDYMPEPWMFFQLASMAFTALSGNGT